MVLLDDLEAAAVTAAHRPGQSLEEYVASVFSNALSLDEDRSRVDSYRSDVRGVAHERIAIGLTISRTASVINVKTDLALRREQQ